MLSAIIYSQMFSHLIHSQVTGDKPLHELVMTQANISISSFFFFKNAFELLNLDALKLSMLFKNHIFQCLGEIFCVEFQRVPLKFRTKYLTHPSKDVDFIHR